MTIVDSVSDFEFNVSKTDLVTDEAVEFTITLNYLDTFTCLIFDGRDESVFLAFGNEEICELHYSPSKFKFIPSPSSKR